MKRSVILISSLLIFSILFSTSCEDKEPFTTTKPIESAIYNQIKAHRENNGIAGPFVQQFIIVQEAQLYSATMAFGTQDVSTSGLQPHWDIIHDKLAGTNELSLVQSVISSSSAEDIVKNWTDNLEIDSLLLGNYTQCGAGVEINNGVAYVTVLMMLFEN